MTVGEDNGRARRRGRRRLLSAVLELTIVGIAVFAGGFIAFVAAVDSRERVAAPTADAIVVLTGGGSRIDRGVRLLTEGRAARLLISGVNPAVSRDALSRTLARDQRPYLDCCIDLDRDATDTIGNARSTGLWAQRLGYRSLIVVTSDYHMPRSLVELGHAMPDTVLVPHPVADAGRPIEELVRRPATLRLLMGEYVKFLGASMRLMFQPRTSGGTFEVAAPLGAS